MLKASSERPCYRQQKSHWYAFAICYPRSVLLLNHWPPLSRRQKDDLLVLFIHQSQGSVVLRNFVFIVTFEKGRSSRIIYSSVTGFCFSSLIRVLCHFWERTTFSYYLFISHRVLLFFVISCLLSLLRKDDLLVLFIHQSQGSIVLRNFVFIVTFEKGRSFSIIYSSVTGFCCSS